MADEKKELPLAQVTQEEYDAMQAQITTLAAGLVEAQAALAKEKTRADDMNGLAARMQADFENYRKRTTEKAKSLKEDGIVAVIEKLIPAMDVLTQALDMINDEKTAEGVKMIFRQLDELLVGFGVSEIPSLGEQFDPNIHNAIMRVDESDAETGTVLEVFQKGYCLGERVIRHSVVKVAG